MNQNSSDIYNLIVNLLNKKLVDRDIYELILKLKPLTSWIITTNNTITDSNNDFKDKSITFCKKTLIDSLEISFKKDYRIHMFFYHKNTSKDPYIVTNAYVFGEDINEDNLNKLKQCLIMVQ